MNNKEYMQIIEKKERLDRRLFDLSSKENIDNLENFLTELSTEAGETVIGVPLVQPYGGPVCGYIALPESEYTKMRAALKSKEVQSVPLEVGVPYDKKRIEISREQLNRKFQIPKAYKNFMEKIKKRGANKIEVYQDLAFNY